MEELTSLLSGITDNNIIYVIVCIVLIGLGIKITKKLIKFALVVALVGYTVFKFAISFNLI